MWVSKITKENLTNDVIDHLLFEGLSDNGASVDCIIDGNRKGLCDS